MPNAVIGKYEQLLLLSTKTMWKDSQFKGTN